MSGSTSPLFTQTNLVSNGAVPADQTDSSLVNPWGIAFAPTGVFWLSDDGTGLTTLYNGTGGFAAAAGNHAITVAPPAGSTAASKPTGVVHNPNASGFAITANGVTAPSVFLFAAQNGTINGWAPTVNGGASTVVAVNDSASGAVFKGLAVSPDGSTLYATDFANGTVDTFNSSFTQTGSFTDSSIPAGFAPFGAQVLNGNLFVTYAEQNPANKAAQLPAAGAGFVDEFSLSGQLEAQVASGGDLNAPWGLAIAPSSFGSLAGDLLVGNFGSGHIDAYNLANDSFQGEVLGANGQPFTEPALWSLTVGNGAAGGSAQQLYFDAGLTGSQGGVFGTLSNNAPITIASVVSQSNGTVVTDESSAVLGSGLAAGTILNLGSGVESVQLTDGTVSTGADTNEAFIQRAYEGLLGRAADPSGLGAADAALAGGASQTTIVNNLLTSAEFAADHGAPSASQIVALDYQGFLGRPESADPSGSAFWTSQLNNNVSAATITAAIANSGEAKAFLAPTTAQVFATSPSGLLGHELYETGLGREIDSGALQNFQAAAASFSPQQFADMIAGSVEFQALHAGQNNTQFVTSLYQDGLGRAPDAGGLAFFTGALAGGATQGQVLLGIASSAEAAGHLTHNLTA